ncbi:ribonucleoside-diphosphate reductase subunit alpha [Candidatus Kaiserbacteria bacterium]|nr:ribonucleoside-diphosphate reductase subunit alpha [Candidatus Kaiserbacteria bacterium]
MLQQIKKRNGDIVPFATEKITIAMKKAFAAEGVAVDDAVLGQMTDRVTAKLDSMIAPEVLPTVEHVQDLVEETLMERGYFRVAKHYILYRFEHTKERKEQVAKEIKEHRLTVEKRDGTRELFSPEKARASLAAFIRGYEQDINLEEIVGQIELEVYDGIKTDELARLITSVLRSRIERDPAYSIVAARQLCARLYKEAIGKDALSEQEFAGAYREAFVRNIKTAVAEKKLDERLLSYDLEKMSAALVPERDDLLRYLGIETLNDRYFIRDKQKRSLETPQYMWMRVALGLALNEADKETRAFEFYNVMSSLSFVPSTPTLFHAGTPHPQLSSCYLNTVEDDLNHIFKVFGDNAQLSKWAGGVGTDWTNIRGTGSLIKSAGITSQGVVPFLKIANDVTVAINRSGRRRGATCVYLENWHYDFEDFLELRKNTGDERRRTHDMDTASWVSDLFMKRVRADGEWTLFSPEEAEGLHETYGREFEALYRKYEDMASRGEIKLFKKTKARDLWKKMLGMLFETGHPWITWKDPSNIRSPQDHVGVVHNSNLCTEITLNTSAEETAVCNLGSINFARHVTDGAFDETKVKATVKTALRMLDNVIDLNFYPTKEAETSNMRHRPVGLGIMGFHDALYQLGINFASPAAVEFADSSTEIVSYYAILSSSELAGERGAYRSFKGSKWDRGILPVDTLKLLEEDRGMPTGIARTESLDWSVVRDSIRQYGMRNSNTMAIAPTATIANISGVVPGIEPIYKNIYVKSNISGDFVIINPYLVIDLKARGLWNEEMLNTIKYNDGSIQDIPQIDRDLKEKYRETFEIDMRWIIRGAAARGKWIDQSQSLNIFFSGTSGEELSDLYLYAWELGLKTTYYLRSLAASQVEKSTVGEAGTHLRTRGDGSVGSSQHMVQNAREDGAIPSPMSTLSPITKEEVEAAKVAVAVSTSQISEQIYEETQISVRTGQYRLHVAEDAVCEACQ